MKQTPVVFILTLWSGIVFSGCASTRTYTVQEPKGIINSVSVHSEWDKGNVPHWVFGMTESNCKNGAPVPDTIRLLCVYPPIWPLLDIVALPVAGIHDIFAHNIREHQELILKGRLLSKEGKPLPNLDIYLSGLISGGVVETNANGEFQQEFHDLQLPQLVGQSLKLTFNSGSNFFSGDFVNGEAVHFWSPLEMDVIIQGLESDGHLKTHQQSRVVKLVKDEDAGQRDTLTSEWVDGPNSDVIVLNRDDMASAKNAQITKSEAEEAKRKEADAEREEKRRQLEDERKRGEQECEEAKQNLNGDLNIWGRVDMSTDYNGEGAQLACQDFCSGVSKVRKSCRPGNYDGDMLGKIRKMCHC